MKLLLPGWSITADTLAGMATGLTVDDGLGLNFASGGDRLGFLNRLRNLLGKRESKRDFLGNGRLFLTDADLPLERGKRQFQALRLDRKAKDTPSQPVKKIICGLTTLPGSVGAPSSR
jgi:hypothetical protein